MLEVLSPWLGVIVLFLLVDAAKVYIEVWSRPQERPYESDLSLVTALVATYNGSAVIKETIQSLIDVGLPRDQILVIDDGSSDGTADVVRPMGVRFYSIPNMGKVSAVNFGVHRVQTPYVLLLDDDTRVGNACIPTNLLQRFDAVAFNVVPDRRDRYGPRGSSLVSCLQRYEYCKSMEIGKRFQDGAASIACVSGAIGLFKKERLQQYHHIHSGAFEGEDLERTLIEHLFRGEVVFADEVVWTVVPDEPINLIKQRLFGWYPAHYHMYFNFVRVLFRKHTPWRLRYEMLYNLFVVTLEPFRAWSLWILVSNLLWLDLLVLYVLYLILEIYPFRIIQRKLDTGKKYGVLFLYPIYSLSHVVLRLAAFFVWAWKRFVSRKMKPKTESDRKWWISPEE